MTIPRNPHCPILTDEAKELLTQLCFRQDDSPKKVDGIFVFGSSTNIGKLAGLLDDILSHSIAKKVFLSGGFIPKPLAKELGIKKIIPESGNLMKHLNLDKFKKIDFITENKSASTYENVAEMFKYKEFRQLKSLLFIFKSHAAGRGYLTLRKFFNEIPIYQQTFDVKYRVALKKINRTNWHTFDFGRNRVWGEYLRIKTYGRQGAIEYDLVKRIIKKIAKATQTE